MRAFSVLLALALAAPSAAQYAGGGGVDHTVERAGSSSFSIGAAAVDASFEATGGPTGAALDGLDGVGLRLASAAVALTAAYASASGGGETAAVDFAFGPRFTPYERKGTEWVAVRVPVRFGFGYNYLRPDAPADSLVTEPTERHHVGRFGVGAGLGVDGGVDTNNSFAREVGGSVSIVLVPGVTTDFAGEPFDRVFAQRSSELDVEVRAVGVGGRGLGFSVGYTLQTTRWSPDGIGSLQDVFDAVRAGSFAERQSVSMFRVGVLF